MTKSWNLNCFEYVSRHRAYEALSEADIDLAASMLLRPGLEWEFIFLNIGALKEIDRLEAAIAHALEHRVDFYWARFLEEEILWLLKLADREKLRSFGPPLPGRGPFKVYRGMHNCPCSESQYGLAWTGSLEAACWQACPYDHKPRILSATLDEEQILYYANFRHQREFIAPVSEATPLQISVSEIDVNAMKHAYRYYPEEVRLQSED